MSSFESHAANDVVFVRYEGATSRCSTAAANDSVRGSLRRVQARRVDERLAREDGHLERGRALREAPARRRHARRPGRARREVPHGVLRQRAPAPRRATRSTRPTSRRSTAARGRRTSSTATTSARSRSGRRPRSRARSTVRHGASAPAEEARQGKGGQEGGRSVAICKSDSARRSRGARCPSASRCAKSRAARTRRSTASKAHRDTGSSQPGRQAEGRDGQGERRPQARYDAATQKMFARDGKGCLAELDTHDRLDARPAGLSTNLKAFALGLRAQCIMLSGQCDAGKGLSGSSRRPSITRRSSWIASWREWRPKRAREANGRRATSFFTLGRARIRRALGRRLRRALCDGEAPEAGRQAGERQRLRDYRDHEVSRPIRLPAASCARMRATRLDYAAVYESVPLAYITERLFPRQLSKAKADIEDLSIHVLELAPFYVETGLRSVHWRMFYPVPLALAPLRVRQITMHYAGLHRRMLDPSSSPSASPSKANILCGLRARKEAQ